MSERDLFCTTNAASTPATPSLDELSQVIREFQEEHPRPDDDVDVIVMTNENYRALEGHAGISGTSSPAMELPPSLGGIPIETFATPTEVAWRVLELARREIRVGYVTNEEKP
ncbi:MAG: hypothetical protein HQ582_06125 [Planctomycetes bacterium]|nr:hypothetical protein [Planctomycetota bacterium]